MDPCGKAGGPIRIGTLVCRGTALCWALGNAIITPLPKLGGNPALDLTAYPGPAFHKAITIWRYAASGIGTRLASSLVLSVRRVWGATAPRIHVPGQATTLARVAERPRAIDRGRRAA